MDEGGASEAVSDAAVVLGAADENSYGFVVVFAPEDVVDEGDVEIDLPQFGLELSGLELDDYVARYPHQPP